MDNFRREAGDEGLSSYPHPWLMPDYWQFPTVSMGLGPLQAIHQAHMMKYLQNRDQANVARRKVWAFLGDGECDEPEAVEVEVSSVQCQALLATWFPMGVPEPLRITKGCLLYTSPSPRDS